MVTGIETAGLVLATFPIVVEGLKCYADGVETIKSWRSYRHELANYARTLKSAKVICLNMIEELLDGIFESEEEWQALKKDPAVLAKMKPQYEDRLKTRLYHDYDDYLEAMPSMFNALQIVREKLSLDDTTGRVDCPYQ